MRKTLRFLFSLCGAGADTTEVERKDRKILAAFEQVWSLAN